MGPFPNPLIGGIDHEHFTIPQVCFYILCEDHARILYEAGLADGLGTSFASGEGIEDRLFAHPVALFKVDEIDGLLLLVS
jgi:hypothetical protein